MEIAGWDPGGVDVLCEKSLGFGKITALGCESKVGGVDVRISVMI